MTTLKRVRYILGLPSGLALTVLVFMDASVEIGAGLLPNTFAKAAVVGVLGAALGVQLHRWHTSHQGASAASFGQPGTTKLALRRGAVIMVGLNSSEPGGAVDRLLTQARSLEYVALVGTPQTVEAGTIAAIVDVLLPASGRDIPATRLRCWTDGHAESIADNEQAVDEAISWMLRHGLDPAEIVVDVTNGRRPMGYGAFAAANQHMVETSYAASEWNHLDNRPTGPPNGWKLLVEYHDDQVGTPDRTHTTA